MNRMNVIVWVSAGVVIGWFVSWIVQIERRRALREMADAEIVSD